jgi:aromatic ring hydroxylase
MTLIEYVQSLQDQGATDIAAKAQKWKEENEYKAPEVSDEAKINPAATQMGAVVAGKKMKASNETFSDSVSIFGNGKSQYQEGDFASTFKNTFGISRKRPKNHFQMQYMEVETHNIKKVISIEHLKTHLAYL